MTWLALAPWQLAIAAAATAAAVIAIYFIKPRHPRVIVPSLALWQRVLADRRPDAFLERLRRLLSLLLALAVALLILAAIGRPEAAGGDRRPRRVAIVVDTSITMLTRTGDGASRWDRARRQARAIVEQAEPADRFLVADTRGRVFVPFTSDRREVMAGLDRMAPGPGERRLPAVDADGAEVLLITDGVGLSPPAAGVSVVSVFEEADNIAIAAFRLRETGRWPESFEAFVEVRNHSPRTRSVELTIGSGRVARVRRALELEPAGSYTEVLDLDGFDAGEVRAALGGPDAFPFDDVAYAFLPERKPIRVALVTTGNAPLETLLRVDPTVEVTLQPPDRFAPLPNADVYVFDRFVPPAVPGPSLSFVGGEQAAAPAGTRITGRVVRPSVGGWDRAHPLGGLSSADLRVARASRLELPEGASMALASGGVPLVATGETPHRWAIVAFDLDESNFSWHQSFPVFVRAALGWLGGRHAVLEESTGLVEVPLPGAAIETIDGSTVPSSAVVGSTVFEADRPGLFVATRGNARQIVAVNASVESSAVNAVTVAGSADWEGRGEGRRGELWVVLLLIATILVCIEWFTYHRRITV